MPHSQHQGIQQSADMLHNRSTLLKLTIYLLLCILLLCVQPVDKVDVVAGNDACSHVWAVWGSSDAIGLSYGPIAIVLLPGSSSGGMEGSQKLVVQRQFGGLTMVDLILSTCALRALAEYGASTTTLSLACVFLMRGNRGGEGRTMRVGCKSVAIYHGDRVTGSTTFF